MIGKRLKYYLIPIFCSVFLFNCGHQEKVIATVNNKTIPLSAFAMQYKSYITKTGLPDNLKLRSEFLFHLIDKEIVYDYAEGTGFIDQEFVKDALNRQKEQDLLNAYYRKFVRPGFEISEVELRKKFRQKNMELHTRYIRAENLEEARKIKKQLTEGKSFERLAKEQFVDKQLAESGGDIGWTKFGDLEIAYEDCAYNLELNEISEPVKLSKGYGIIQLLNKRGNVFINEQDFLIRKDKFERQLLERYHKKFVQDFTDELVENNNLQIDDEKLNLFFVKMDKNSLFKEEINAEKLNQLPQGIILSTGKFDWSAMDLVKNLKALTPFQMSQIKSVYDFRQAVIGLASRQIIEQEIAESKLAQNEEVVVEIERNRFERVLKEFKTAYEDTIAIPEDFLREHYEKNKDYYKTEKVYELSEIAVSDSGLATKLREKINSLSDFERIATRYSVLERSNKKKGYIGELRESQLGLLQDSVVAAAKRESVIGPFYYNKKHYIFYVHEIEHSHQMDFDEAVKQIIAEKLLQYREAKYRKFIHQLRTEAKIEIDHQLLKKYDIIERRNV